MTVWIVLDITYENLGYAVEDIRGDDINVFETEEDAKQYIQVMKDIYNNIHIEYDYKLFQKDDYAWNLYGKAGV